MRNLINELVRVEPAKKQIADLIKKIESGYIEKQGPEFKRKRSFSPSTLVWGHGRCARFWYLAFEGANFEEERSPKAYATMKNGTAAHERLQQAMENAGVLKEKEIKVVNNNPPVFGYCDADIEFEGWNPLVEIKTAKSESFGFHKQRQDGAKYHIEQLLMYMRILGRDQGLILYESKNDHELLGVLVEWTAEYTAWADYLFGWLKETHMAWRNKQIPKKTYRANSKVCRECPLQQACLEAEAGEITIKPLQGLK